MAQLPQRFRLDLADPLAGDIELPSYLFERARSAVVQAKAQTQYLLLPLGQRIEHFHELFMQQCIGCRIDRNLHMIVLNEIAQMTVFLLADRCLQGNRIL